ncbi:hypothetical protein FSHL1_009652 [Fusarium sambucinum]
MRPILTRDEWITRRAAPYLEDLDNQHKTCHLDDAITLCHYLNGEMNAKSAARLITTMVREEAIRREVTMEPFDTIFGTPIAIRRIMLLLADSLWRFVQEREMILDLIIAIQDLPPDGTIHWHELPRFNRIWLTCYNEQLSMTDGKDVAFFKKAGNLEATMYLRGIPVSEDDEYPYGVINLVSLEWKTFEFEIHMVHEWLKVAGLKLAKNLQPAHVKALTRAVRGRRGKTYMIQITMYEHWEHWKKRFLQVSHDENFLSTESRQVAKHCHEIMKGLVVKQPDPPTEE